MRVVDNEDGTVTVFVPKVPETYNVDSGELEVSETLAEDDFAAQSVAAPDARA